MRKSRVTKELSRIVPSEVKNNKKKEKKKSLPNKNWSFRNFFAGK